MKKKYSKSRKYSKKKYSKRKYSKRKYSKSRKYSKKKYSKRKKLYKQVGGMDPAQPPDVGSGEVEQPSLPTNSADVISMFDLTPEDIDRLTTFASNENEHFIDPISHEIMLFPMKLDDYEQYRFEYSIIMECLARKKINPMTNLATAGNLALDILLMKNIHRWIFDKLSNQADFPNHDLSNIRIVDDLKPEDCNYYNQMGLSLSSGFSPFPSPPPSPPPAIGPWWKKFAVSALAFGMMASRYSGTSSEVGVTSTPPLWNCSNAGGRCSLTNPIELTRMQQKAKARGASVDMPVPYIGGSIFHSEYVPYSADNIGDGTITEHADLPQGVYLTKFGEKVSLDSELPGGGWRKSAVGPAWLDDENILHVKLVGSQGRMKEWEGKIDKDKIYENINGNLREAPVEGCETIEGYRDPGITMREFSRGGQAALDALPIAWRYPNGFMALTEVDGSEVPESSHLRRINQGISEEGKFTPIDQLPKGPWKEYAAETAWVDGNILHAKLLQPDPMNDGKLSIKPPTWREYPIMPGVEYGNLNGELEPLATDIPELRDADTDPLYGNDVVITTGVDDGDATVHAHPPSHVGEREGEGDPGADTDTDSDPLDETNVVIAPGVGEEGE